MSFNNTQIDQHFAWTWFRHLHITANSDAVLTRCIVATCFVFLWQFSHISFCYSKLSKLNSDNHVEYESTALSLLPEHRPSSLGSVCEGKLLNL